MDTLNAINEKIASFKTHLETNEKETAATTDMQSICEKDSHNAEPLMEPQQEADEEQTMPIPDLSTIA